MHGKRKRAGWRVKGMGSHTLQRTKKKRNADEKPKSQVIHSSSWDVSVSLAVSDAVGSCRSIGSLAPHTQIESFSSSNSHCRAELCKLHWRRARSILYLIRVSVSEWVRQKPFSSRFRQTCSAINWKEIRCCVWVSATEHDIGVFFIACFSFGLNCLGVLCCISVSYLFTTMTAQAPIAETTTTT